MKIKVTNNFTVSKETLNAKTFEKNEDNVQLILYRYIMNEFFKNNYRN